MAQLYIPSFKSTSEGKEWKYMKLSVSNAGQEDAEKNHWRRKRELKF